MLNSLLRAVDNKVRANIYYPDAIQCGSCSHQGVAFSPITVPTDDGLAIRGLASEIPAEAKCCVLFFHGNGGCAATRAHLVAPFFKLGAQVVVADYRGYGGNPGHPTEMGLMQDARAFLKFAIDHSELPLIIVGHSLGGNIAVQLVAEKSDSIAGLITVGTVASVAALVPAVIRRFVSDKFLAIEKASEIKIPWTIAHDVGDPTVSLMNSIVLSQANIANRHMKLITLNNRAHDFASDNIGSILLDHIASLHIPAPGGNSGYVEAPLPN
ncbi:alpha/beta fold hydrolase (plasmid) [Rhizobium sp. CB3171]|uniref:alpha/beta hydrolase n=1 Tax=Rhizobium sp. CB3171 TaxID=3039157 RepID=UPI0024B1EAF9|nr:alpha/beta fold hydrolase [Rhizobium sp. CB3171]WFU06277.1 alpha/beta fold hydrolase [Rhizobium sp. CB3171]